MIDDRQLLDRYLQEHSEAAFAELVQRHLGLVYSTALRRVGRDTHLAEDVAQTVFADLARKAPTLRDRASLAGWCYVSAQLASAKVVRSERRRKQREIEAQTMQNLTPGDESAASDLARVRAALDRLILGLREEEREVIALRFFQQRSFADIGTALRLTDDAARKRVDRSLEKMRLALERNGITSTAGMLTIALAELGGGAGAPATLATKVTAHALAHAAGAGPLASLIPILAFAGALVAGLFLVTHQFTANRSRAAELAAFGNPGAALATVRQENAQLMERLRDVEDLRRAAAALPAVRRALSPTVAVSARTAPTRATLTVQADGTIYWGGDRVSLRDCIARMQALPETASGGGEAKLGIRSFAPFPAMAWAVDEARKASLAHVVVESSAAIDPKMGRWMWFGPQ